MADETSEGIYGYVQRVQDRGPLERNMLYSKI
jgi:hypothetical protein